jgi:hypothetical protein
VLKQIGNRSLAQAKKSVPNHMGHRQLYMEPNIQIFSVSKFNISDTYSCTIEQLQH